jgi:hypothetical protein
MSFNSNYQSIYYDGLDTTTIQHFFIVLAVEKVYDCLSILYQHCQRSYLASEMLVNLFRGMISY